MKIRTFGILLLLFSPFLAFADFQADLHYGSVGEDVTALQEFLTDQNVYTGPITGHFYALTLRAVRLFQAKEGVVPTSGYFGPITRSIANQLLDVPLSEGDATTTQPAVNLSTTTGTGVGVGTVIQPTPQIIYVPTSTPPQIIYVQVPTPPSAPTSPQPVATPAPTCNVSVTMSTNNSGDIVTKITWSSTNATKATLHLFRDEENLTPVSAGSDNYKYLPNMDFPVTFYGDGGSVECKATTI